MPAEFACEKCGKVWPSQKARSGHMGGSTRVIGSWSTVQKHGERRAYQKEVRLHKLGLLPEGPCVLCSRANAAYIRDSRAKGRLAARKGR